MNYQKMMEGQIADFQEKGYIGVKTPTLLLHSCCGPCSSSVIAGLTPFFNITVFYYNPNIDEKEEYEKRSREQERLIHQMPAVNAVRFLGGEYRSEDFLNAVKNHENDSEGGGRCSICYALRLEKTAKTASEGHFNYFTTTLSVSPMKDAERINAIGSASAKKNGVQWLWSDFKKKDGYKKSVELSKRYDLYRQDYCGCSFSRKENEPELS